MKAFKFFLLLSVFAVSIQYPIYSSAGEPDIFLSMDVSSGDVSSGDVSSGDNTTEEPEKPLDNPDDGKETKKTEYEIVMDKVISLYKLAKIYIEEENLEINAGELVCLYIRSERYNSYSWSVFAGKRIPDFERYVKETDVSLCELQKIKSLTLPTGETTDFVHMMATLNMYYKNSGALGGWAGDAAQMVLNIKNEKGTLEELTEKASFFMGADNNSYFGKEDFYADLDAANIYVLTKKHSLPAAIGTYYKNLTPKKRVRDFVDNTFSPKSFKRENFRETVYSSFTVTSHINTLLESFGLRGNTYKNHIKACVYSFADYLLTYYEPEPVSIYVEPVKNINLEKRNGFTLSCQTVPETDFEISVVLPENGKGKSVSFFQIKETDLSGRRYHLFQSSWGRKDSSFCKRISGN